MEDIQSQYSALRAPAGVQRPMRFGHLMGYGGRYYSYLWCRALVAMVWRSVFEEDPLSRTAGERVRRTMLASGNARDPWDAITELLGRRPTVDDLVQALGQDLTS